MPNEKKLWTDFKNMLKKVNIDKLNDKKDFDSLIEAGYDVVVDVCAARKNITNTAHRTPILAALTEEEKETGITGMLWCLSNTDNVPTRMLTILAKGQCSLKGKFVGPKSHWTPYFKQFYEDMIKQYNFS